MEHSRHARLLTRRFVAGNELPEAIAAVRELGAQGLTASLDALGESVQDASQALHATQQYMESVRCIAGEGLPSTVSLKLTQLGLNISQNLCGDHLMSIVDAGRSAGIRVEIDMEASEYVDRTLELVRHAHGSGGRVRAVIQAYLHRSERDIADLNRMEIPVRLCKGAYMEAPELAIQRKRDLDTNFIKLATLLLREGTVPAIATHDDRMINASLEMIAADDRKPESYEFQMLYGIRRELQTKLASEGHPVRVYIPYGEAWYPYLMRRMAERPANLLFVLRNLLHK